nr:unnamed protein product [Callosobruchus analis]
MKVISDSTHPKAKIGSTARIPVLCRRRSRQRRCSVTFSSSARNYRRWVLLLGDKTMNNFKIL